MNKIVGFCMLAFSVGMVAYSYQDDSFLWDTQKYAQVGISSVGALWLLIMPSIANLKPLLASLIMKVSGAKRNPDMPLKPDADAPVDTPIYNTTDYQALNYLKKRVKELESTRGFEIVVELNTIMFSGTDAVEVEKPDDKQS
jgi:hypothetical protein